MTTQGEIRTEIRDDVGWVTLARPGKKNALTVAMWTAIPGAFRALAAREELVAVVVQGADGTFGAGADIEDVVRATLGRAEAEAYCRVVVTAILAIATCPLPTVALVAGVAAGGAAEIAIAADVRFAGAGATFSFPFARLGVVPDAFTLQRLLRLVGPSRARRIVLTGEKVDAPRALAMGLVDEVADEGQLAAAVASWAAGLRDGSRRARAGMKAALLEREGPLDVESLIRPMVASFEAGEVRAAALGFLQRT